MHRLIISLLSVLVFLPAHAGGSKKPKLSLSFHRQTPPGETQRMVFGYRHLGKVHAFRRLPDFITTDFVEYEPFLSEDRISYGAVFTLDEIKGKRLTSLTIENKGRYLLPMIDGRPSEPVVIDKVIRDRKVVIWNGLSQTEVHMLDLLFPRSGEDKAQWKERKKVAKQFVKGYKTKKKKKIIEDASTKKKPKKASYSGDYFGN